MFFRNSHTTKLQTILHLGTDCGRKTNCHSYVVYVLSKCNFKQSSKAKIESHGEENNNFCSDFQHLERNKVTTFGAVCFFKIYKNIPKTSEEKIAFRHPEFNPNHCALSYFLTAYAPVLLKMFKKNFDHELRRLFATLVDKQAHEELGCFMNIVVLFEGLLPGTPKQNILRAKRSGLR